MTSRILAILIALATAQAVPARAELLPHPAGCPARLFCGCGAAVRVFGSPVRSLWLAANWLRFPRTSPAPGMVAARPGHVMVIEAQGSRPGLWMVYDANSGHGATQLHERGLAGYTIVDPHSGRQRVAQDQSPSFFGLFTTSAPPTEHRRGRHHGRRLG